MRMRARSRPLVALTNMTGANGGGDSSIQGPRIMQGITAARYPRRRSLNQIRYDLDISGRHPGRKTSFARDNHTGGRSKLRPTGAITQSVAEYDGQRSSQLHRLKWRGSFAAPPKPRFLFRAQAQLTLWRYTMNAPAVTRRPSWTGGADDPHSKGNVIAPESTRLRCQPVMPTIVNTAQHDRQRKRHQIPKAPTNVATAFRRRT